MTQSPLSVRVPASTSNLGPGFDLLGLCLGLWLEVRLEERAGPGEPTLGERTGEAEAWPTEGNRLLQGFRAAAGSGAHPEDRSFVLHAHSEVPVGRGFGSTGAACAAGLLLGRAVRRAAAAAPHEPAPHAGTPDDPTDDAGTADDRLPLVAAGAALEGHPDNVTASLLGGCTLALRPNAAEGPPRADDTWSVLRPEVSDDLGLAVAWGATPLDTPTARGVLPANVPFALAADQPRRLAFLLEGLRTGDPQLLALGAMDHLHERHRLPLVRGGAEALEAARGAGAHLACLSGAGAGLVALGPRAAMLEVALAMAECLDRVDGPGHGKVLDLVREAPRVERG